MLQYTDSYKLSHKGFMNEGTELIYSNMTPRNAKHFPSLDGLFNNKAVFFGLQHFIKSYLIDEWSTNFFNLPKDEVIAKYKRRFDTYLGPGAVPMDHFEELHDLGYLPIRIKALPEGSEVNMGVPFYTIQNTHSKFAWLTNYLETVMSCETWKSSTTATIIRDYRKLAIANAKETTGSDAGTEFQIHGFEHRGMSGRADAAINGAAFLLSSCGTDTVPALDIIEDSYNANAENEFLATSVPASEHSIASLGTSVEGELESYRRWITESYPEGVVSLVSDTYDYWKVLTEYLPALKEDILARPKNALGLSKVVVRPDSGNPADIICGKAFEILSYKTESFDEWKECVADNMDNEFRVNLDAEDPHHSETQLWKLEDRYFKVIYEPDLNRYDKQYYYVDNDGSPVEKCKFEEFTPTAEDKGSIEIFWEIFGGTVTDQGYKVLDEHIGLIYGDSITLPLAQEIFTRLKAKGFATTNVILGVGSYTMNYLTRDSLGMAVKATYAKVNGKGYELFKDPITDDGTKKSAKGLLRVEKEGCDYILYDQQSPEQEQQGELKVVFEDGDLKVDHVYSDIRERLWG